MDKLLQTILNNTYTLQSLHKRINFLKEYFNFKFFSDPKYQENNPFSKANLDWLGKLGLEFENGFTKDNFSTIFSALDEEVKKIIPLTVYFAVDLPDEKIDEIGNFIRLNFNPNLIIDLKLDPSLLAGCALVYKGIYKDYSVKKRVEENRDKVLTEFKAFLH